MLLLLPTICGVSMLAIDLTGKPSEEATLDDCGMQRAMGVLILLLTFLIGSGR
jgi:hypothetical protein